MSQVQTLNIVQYNVQKRYDTTSALLRDPAMAKYNIIVIQEPWLNSYNKMTHNPTGGLFRTFMVEDNIGDDRQMVCFLVNTKRFNVKDIRASCRGTCVITLYFDLMIDGRTREFAIHNVYNPSSSKAYSKRPEGTEHTQKFGLGRYEGLPIFSALPELDAVIEKSREKVQIIVGDFNLKHEHWYGKRLPTQRSHQRHTQFLLDMMAEYSIELCTPPGTVTRPPSSTRGKVGSCIDLAWASPIVHEHLFRCAIAEELDYQSDHRPLVTEIGFTPQAPPIEKRRSFKNIDTVKFTETVTALLPRISAINTKEDLEEAVNSVIAALQKGVEASTPLVRINHVFTRPNFTGAAADAIKDSKRAWRRVYGKHGKITEENLIALQLAVRKRKEEIQKANTKTHRDKVAEVDTERKLWNLAKWAKNREAPRAAYTPDIRRKDGGLAEDLEGKCNALREALFPAPPPAQLDDIDNYVYKPSQGNWEVISESEVHETILTVPPDKAPGDDELPNRVLKVVADLLAPLLAHLFNTSLRLGHCPEHFKVSISVVIKKMGKSDYSAPKSYRPIALMNTLGKIMDAILAKRIAYLAEKYRMLPLQHAGGRKLASCDHGIHVFLEGIHSAWREGKVASLLLLDVSGAFDNVSHKRLLHNMRKRGLPLEILGWMESYLRGRRSRIKLSEGTARSLRWTQVSHKDRRCPQFSTCSTTRT
jgi:hypothetical protein